MKQFKIWNFHNILSMHIKKIKLAAPLTYLIGGGLYGLKPSQHLNKASQNNAKPKQKYMAF